MKLLLYVVGGFVVFGGAVVLVAGAGGQSPDSPVILLALMIIVGVPSLGAIWMMYMSIRYEKKPFRFILLALIPFTSFWYYFERVRPRRW